jgi:hypothetical protein
MRIWAKIFDDNHLIKDLTVEDYSSETRTHKVYAALDKVCMEFDLSKPIWFDKNVAEFKRHAKTRFRHESFIEEVPFEYLEFEIIEED